MLRSLLVINHPLLFNPFTASGGGLGFYSPPYPPCICPTVFSHYSQLYVSGSLFVNPTAPILSIVTFACTSVHLYVCTTVHPYYCTAVLLYSLHMSPLHMYYVSSVHSSLLHLGSKLSFSTLYIILVKHSRSGHSPMSGL